MDGEGCWGIICFTLLCSMISGYMGYASAGYDYRALQVECGKAHYDEKTGAFIVHDKGGKP